MAAVSGLMLGLAAPSQAQQVPTGALSVPAYAPANDNVRAASAPEAGTFKASRAAFTSSSAPAPVASRSGHTHAAPAPVASRSGHTHAAPAPVASRSGHTHAAPAPVASRSGHTHATSNSEASEESTIAPVADSITPMKSSKSSDSSGKLGSIASMALKFEGAPYVWGGDSPAGWDCSGFIQYVYGKAGISLPHNTTAIRTSGKFVKTSNPKPGDLVYQNGGSHAGIYIGGGKIIGAQNPSVDTVIRDADSPYGPLMGYYTLAN
ncbi:cell wall lytic activity [Arthrobacter sp. AQ5-05]|nr:cell wall lytic activity [Arthrobacter sp. AQ5-05]